MLPEKLFPHLPDSIQSRLLPPQLRSKSLIRLLAGSLETGGIDDYDQLWYAAHLVPDGPKFLAEYIRLVTLPSLLRNFDGNRFRVAAALSFVDSRTLNPKTRSTIGLSKKPLSHPPSNNDSLPVLFQPPSSNWKQQCGRANYNLHESFLRMQGLVPPLKESLDNVGFELLGCLAAKTCELVSGLCFETTEFANGQVFVKDVWYLCRDHLLIMKLIELSNLAQQTDPATSADIYGNIEGIKISHDLVVWENCGGTWQPTREVYQL